ncbi:hypothetical protein ACFXKC_49750 [Streptomyces sp. NPDC059340]|uniref:hypothetical protein n=1 Tax=Streptomyces sp. NPDC059340 TaxID=3346806 RepID=UPI0036C0FAFD
MSASAGQEPGQLSLARIAEHVRPEIFRTKADRLREGTDAWRRRLDGPCSTRFPWTSESTYIRRPRTSPTTYWAQAPGRAY